MFDTLLVYLTAMITAGIIGINPIPLGSLEFLLSGALIGLTGGWVMIRILESARKRAAELKQ